MGAGTITITVTMIMTTTMTEATDFADPALLRLLQLSSPALPIGAYSYSQGLEYAVEVGWVNDAASTSAWLRGILEQGHRYLEVPILARLYDAWDHQDSTAIAHWTAMLVAGREGAELQAEEQHLGAALARVLVDQGLDEAVPWLRRRPVSLATLWSLAAVRWGVPQRGAILAYLWAWTENQVTAAIKLVPLGQSAGQRLLAELMPTLTATLDAGLAVADEDIGAGLPGIALASGGHEVQYSRLFRS